MLLFAHLGLTLAASKPVRRAIPVYVLLGSMLPDLIDKPLGELLFGTAAMGRTICHTLAFLLLLSAVAYYREDLRLASFAGGVSAHLMLDLMWNSPRTLLWPLLGAFPPAAYLSTLDYLQVLLRGLSDPMVAVPEMLGLAYLVYFAWQLRADIGSWVLKRLPLPASETRQ